MKKLLILTTFGILIAAASGCRMCDWLWRGSAVTAQPASVYCDPCAVPACDPCAPACGSTGTMMVPAGTDATYMPAPR